MRRTRCTSGPSASAAAPRRRSPGSGARRAAPRPAVHPRDQSTQSARGWRAGRAARGGPRADGGTRRLTGHRGSRLCARSMTPRVVAIGGGKGGVGKSLVAANVGIFLATLGKRVILVDGAFGAPNLHIFAGVPRPSRSLAEALSPSAPALSELAVATYVPGVRLVGG